MAAKPAAAPAPAASDTQAYRGQRLGLPESGPGSLATLGRRAAAIAIDWGIAYGLAALIVGSRIVTTGQFAAFSILAVAYLIGLAINGATFGMALLGLRVTMPDGSKPGLYTIAMRTILLFLVIPPVVTDQDGRGLHDLIAKTLVVNTR